MYMHNGNSIIRCEYRIVANSYSRDNDINELLGADQEKVFEAHVLIHDTFHMISKHFT